LIALKKAVLLTARMAAASSEMMSEASIADEIRSVQQSISKTESDIADVEHNLEKAEKPGEVTYLRKKEEQLRKKEEQLRKEKEQLRNKEKEMFLLRTQGGCCSFASDLVPSFPLLLNASGAHTSSSMYPQPSI
jgi:DNA repair exonuclease SbcCD ATPase subunit